ncbi:MAG TPA: hypothetical protein VMY40_05975 [Anaerolineae bacterium]|nr:hypothetical protein [Anaerolineae bacterium]
MTVCVSVLGLLVSGYSSGQFFPEQWFVEIPVNPQLRSLRPDQNDQPDFGANWIETVQMFAQPFSLTGARSDPMRYEQHWLPRPEVVASLEHSLKEHGDIWAELAKH